MPWLRFKLHCSRPAPDKGRLPLPQNPRKRTPSKTIVNTCRKRIVSDGFHLFVSWGTCQVCLSQPIRDCWLSQPVQVFWPSRSVGFFVLSVIAWGGLLSLTLRLTLPWMRFKSHCSHPAPWLGGSPFLQNSWNQHPSENISIPFQIWVQNKMKDLIHIATRWPD